MNVTLLNLLSMQCINFISETSGHVVAHLVEALRYQPEGHGFDSRWCY